MCEIQAVLIVADLALAATGFCIYQVMSDKKAGHNSHLKSESPSGKEYRAFCLNGGECYYLIDEYFVGCNCTWLYGGKRFEKYIRWTLVNCSSAKSDAL